MDLSFYKLHSTGGDYIISSFLHRQPPDLAAFSKVASSICKRRTGVGANGLLVLTGGIEHALKAFFFQANGLQGPLPGDAIICMGRFAFDSGLVTNSRISCESDYGVVTIDAIDSTNLRIDLGPPRNPLNNSEISPTLDINLNETVNIADKRLPITAIRLNADYVVVNTERRPRAVRTLAAELSLHRDMACRQPVYMRSLSYEEIAIYSWAFAGKTPDHSGAAAACVVAGILNGFCDNEVTVRFRSYLLYVQWLRREGRVLVTAPSEYICSGSYYIDLDYPAT